MTQPVNKIEVFVVNHYAEPEAAFSTPEKAAFYIYRTRCGEDNRQITRLIVDEPADAMLAAREVK